MSILIALFLNEYYKTEAQSMVYCEVIFIHPIHTYGMKHRTSCHVFPGMCTGPLKGLIYPWLAFTCILMQTLK